MKSSWPSWILRAFTRIENYYNSNKLFHAGFAVGMVIKGIDGILEIAGSFVVLFIDAAHLNRIAAIFTQHELSEDSHDIFAQLVLKAAHDLSTSTHYFASAYLFAHGMMKIVLVLMLLKKKPWAYPMAEIFLLIFIIVQGYRYSISHSIWLIPLTGIDIAILLLIWLEYRRIRKLS
jgi:uncharacterized membrane protein